MRYSLTPVLALAPPSPPFPELMSEVMAEWYSRRMVTTPTGVRWVAAQVGVTRRTVDRWNREGMSEAVADRVACALGHHPVTLWPDFGRQAVG